MAFSPLQVCVSLSLRCARRRRLLRPTRGCLALLLPAAAMAAAGLAVSALAGSDRNYPFTHR